MLLVLDLDHPPSTAAPTTVTLAPPVVGAFVLTPLLGPPTSLVMHNDIVTGRFGDIVVVHPMSRSTLLLDFTHRLDPDVHLVACAPVALIRTCPDNVDADPPYPLITVMLMLPVAAVFVLS
jgi:hypothetical protein